MTREEVIAYFNGMLEAGGYTEPIEMAIEALQQQEEYITRMDEVRRAYDNISRAKPCDDCVSRKAAIDACLKGLNRKEMVANIKALPPVTPAQKTGYWIIVNERAGIYRCSVCNELSCCGSFYCHNCGAKMEEVDE